MFARSLALLLFALTTLHAFQTPASHCEALETKLKDDPGNAQVREDLVTCYFQVEMQVGVAGGNIQPIDKKRADQVLWLIQHKPEAAFLGSPTAALQPSFAGDDASSTVKSAWRDQIKAHPASASILFNASNSLMLSDFDTAVDLAEKAHGLDGDNKEISLRLGQLYGLELQYAAPEQREQIAHFSSLKRRYEALQAKSGSYN